MQTLFGNGADGSPPGNCFAACVASILELPPAEVPNFMEGLPTEWRPEDPLRWTRAFCAATNAWLAPRGFAYVELPVEGGLPAWVWEIVPQTGFWVGIGERVAGSGNLHAVVMRGREMVHDPSPARRGLERFVGIGLLVPLDPAARR